MYAIYKNVNQLEEETLVSKSLLDKFNIFLFNKILKTNLPKKVQIQ